ncbi:MAG: TlpA disulfide reductase family protein [Bacteroidales bacterium]|nr:TlpA disulfide reductase family protein [Bacteroidales bacterium]MDD3664803.1 TlpA disulfide reductase family protein [Bacteroidales bacterium]
MKKALFTSLLILSVFSVTLAQEKTEKILPKLPSVDVKTPDGKIINTATLSNDGKPMIISFWALWCKPCIKELTTIADVYDEWQEETGVKIIAVSIDDARSSARVKPTADGKGWTYDLILDQNSDFKRAMNVNLIPHTFLINGKGEIVWQHTSFSEGAELELIELVRKVSKGEDITE